MSTDNPRDDDRVTGDGSAGVGATETGAMARRDFLARSATWAMGGGLVLGYGTLGVMAARYLYPPPARDEGWRFVVPVTELTTGQSLEFTAPSGATIVVARHGTSDEADSFIALSNVCPHLGCHVHWEESNSRFFCPCHNGIFDRSGKATAGPPEKAGQSLRQFPLQVTNGLLFIRAPLSVVGQSLAAAPTDARRFSLGAPRPAAGLTAAAEQEA